MLLQKELSNISHEKMMWLAQGKTKENLQPKKNLFFIASLMMF